MIPSVKSCLLTLITIIALNLNGQIIDESVRAQLSVKDKVNVLISFSTDSHFKKDMSAMSKSEKGNYVYRTLLNTAKKSQQSIINYFNNHDIPFSSFYIVNAISTKLNQQQAERVLTFTGVDKIMPDPLIHNEIVKTTVPPQATMRAQYTYGLSMLEIPKFWETTGSKGKGAVIGGQDTGYEWTHPAIKPAYRGNINGGINHNYNWHDAITQPLDTNTINICGYGVMSPCDDLGHGTHTMGTMVGNDVTDRIFGLAPEAEWIGCRNMESGVGRPSTYLECFEWFLAPTDLNGENPRPDLAPDIINNSWSCPLSEGCNKSNFELLEMAVNNLTRAGILTVVSAGNSGSECSSVSTPASIYENSFTIGAVNNEREVANFSSRGPVLVDSSLRIKPNVVAPGVYVFSSYPVEKYRYASGTSMSGPHAAGMAALLISAYPELKGKPLKLMNIIEKSAIPLGEYDSNCYADKVPNNTWGYGLINSINAMNYYESLKTDKKPELEVEVRPTISSHNILFRYFSESPEKLSLKIYNAIGETVFSRHDIPYNRYYLNTHKYPAGTYFYVITDGKSINSGKIMIH